MPRLLATVIAVYGSSSTTARLGLEAIVVSAGLVVCWGYALGLGSLFNDRVKALA